MVTNYIETKLVPDCSDKISVWSEKKRLRHKLRSIAIDKIFEKLHFIKN